MSSPNNIGSSKSSNRKAKSENKGKAFMRCHGAAVPEITLSIVWHSRSGHRAEVRRTRVETARSASSGSCVYHERADVIEEGPRGSNPPPSRGESSANREQDHRDAVIAAGNSPVSGRRILPGSVIPAAVLGFPVGGRWGGGHALADTGGLPTLCHAGTDGVHSSALGNGRVPCSHGCMNTDQWQLAFWWG
jgi:hypothetical protein